ncbi:MAG: GspMb/PilO family protein [Gammaproteobacteria bacterium]|nr:GspMb/PilO family protein [Gammaproteobacteria bacterium]
MPLSLGELKQHPWMKEALGAIGLILLLALALDLGDRVAAARAALQAEQDAAARLSSLDLTLPWPNRFEQANSRLSQLQSSLWQAPTPGVAVAQLQDTINALARRYKLEDFRLQMGEPIAVEGHQLTSVRGRLDFRFAPQQMLGLLNEIDTHQPRLYIRELELRQRSGSRGRLVIEAYLHAQTPGVVP